jgi:hypothetical protein
VEPLYLAVSFTATTLGANEEDGHPVRGLIESTRAAGKHFDNGDSRMARITQVLLTCDLHGDGTEAAATATLTTDTGRVEIDLCRPHLDELTSAGRALSPGSRRSKSARPPSRASARPKARKGSGTASPKRASASKKASSRRGRASLSAAAVREWARSEGYTVAERGRIPSSIRTAYSAAQTP